MEVTTYVMLGTLFGVCQGEYIAINPKPSGSPCDTLSSTALLERFFDLIFTEFHNTPPACVCIQTCSQHPTYCYPNGCLKRTERKKVEEATYMMTPAPTPAPRVNYEGTTKSATFGIDHRAIVDDLLERPALLSACEDSTEKPNTNDLIPRPNPFKELVLKYNKKVPKLEMKYNLREQVKNTKTYKLNKEKNIDISRTRWPMNKHLLHGKSPFHRVRSCKKSDDIMQSKFFVSMFPDYDPLNYSPVYKRYLAKRENNNGVNVEAIYLYQTDTANITLETLIDNLLESSLNKSEKDTRLRFNLEVESTKETNKNSTEYNFILEEENEKNAILNNNNNIISINSTNENIDVNKYSHDINFTNHNTVSEMIAIMTNEIEKQNKASMEFMERVTGIKKTSIKSTTDISLQYNVTDTSYTYTTDGVNEKTNATKSNTEFTTENIDSNENFTTTMKPVPVTKSSMYKKNQHRIVRKLKRRKLH